MLWGFIPCGLTYSILATALVTGSGARGAGLMLAFGLGTLPNLLLAGMLFKRFRDLTRHPKVRLASGLLVLGSLIGLADHLAQTHCLPRQRGLGETPVRR